MIERLRQLDIANDELIRDLQQKYDLKHEPECTTSNFLNVVTLKTVTDPRFVRAAKEYIQLLVKDWSRYGYLYELWKHNMYLPLDVHLNAELVVEHNHYDPIVKELNELARNWGIETTQIFEITRLELLYFFVLILNPKCNWITIDYIVGGVRRHAHLIAAPTRLLRNREKRPQACKSRT